MYRIRHIVKTYMFEFARHGVCARGPAGVVQNDDAVCDDERSDGHDEDQVPGRKIPMHRNENPPFGKVLFPYRCPVLNKRAKTNPIFTQRHSLSDKRYRERCFWNLLSNQKEEDGLSQEDGDGHGYLLSSRWKGIEKKYKARRKKKGPEITI